MSRALKDKILELKKERQAIILAHYYQIPEIQEIADAVGDSYNLSKIAQSCSEKMVMFCGVRFMAESAKILSPEKTILLPAANAGCPMADMAAYEDLIELQREHPNAVTVSYINSSTEVKAISDVCVTSSSATKIIENLNKDEIIFLPDKNLGGYIAEQFPNKKFIFWNGYCVVHSRISPEDILKMKDKIKDIVVLVHPECEAPVRKLADFIGSTGEIIKYATESPSKNFLIVTEEGVIHQLKKHSPDKNFYVPGEGMTCVNMKKTTLKNVYEGLLNMENQIEIDEEIRVKAYNALNNMHKLSR